MKQLKIFLLLLLLLSMSLARAEKTEEESYQRTILQEVNRYRHSQGLPSLKLHPYISQVARKHSLNMATHAIEFGHQNFNDRIKLIYSKLPFSQAGAENIAYYKIPPKAVVQKWLTSRGHRRNIEGNYNLTGIGIVRDKAGWVYYTQIFLRTTNQKSA